MPSIQRRVFGNKSPLLPKLPICPVCNEAVALEIAKTDESGKATHEECYLRKMGVNAATTRPAKA